MDPGAHAGLARRHGARRAALDLALPIDCRPGVDCWILRYVDHDPGPGVRDYACGKLAGDGHKGTDFAIRDQAAMVAGVEVRAAAAGIVDALRDGMPDQILEGTAARRSAAAPAATASGSTTARAGAPGTAICDAAA